MLSDISLVKLVSCSLASYRLAQLVSIDFGPMHVFEYLRLRLNKRAYQEQILKRGKLGVWQSIAEGVSCPYCVGVWIAFFISALSLLNSSLVDFFVFVLAVSGGQALLQGERHAE